MGREGIQTPTKLSFQHFVLVPNQYYSFTLVRFFTPTLGRNLTLSGRNEVMLMFLQLPTKGMCTISFVLLFRGNIKSFTPVSKTETLSYCFSLCHPFPSLVSMIFFLLPSTETFFKAELVPMLLLS